MELLVLAVVAILILALIGFIQIILWIAKAADSRRGYSAPPPPAAWQPLTRAQKLMMVEELLGERMPADLAEELRALTPWRYPPRPVVVPPEPTPPSPVVSATALPDLSQVKTPEPSPAAPPPSPVEATFNLGTFAAPAGFMVGDASVDDSPLAIPADVAAAAEDSPSKLKLLLSFENIIFLLAACLILGGTLYLVATTWDRVSSGYQYLYAESLLVFYGWVLLATGLFLRRREGLDAAAAVLAGIASAMSVAAAELAAAGFGQGAGVGALGAVLAQVLALPATALLMKLHAQPRRLAAFFGIAIAALSGAGACFAGEAPAAGSFLLAMVALASPALLLRAVPVPRATLFLVALAPALGACLLPTTMELPAMAIAPALAVLGFACRPTRRVLPQLFAVPALFIFIGLGLGLGHASLPLLVAVAAIGLLATMDLAAEAPNAGLFLLGAGLALFLAFFWTAGFGMQPWPENLSDLDGSLAQLTSFPIAALGALPFALAGFAISLCVAPTRAKQAIEWLAYVISILALLLAASSFPNLGVLGAVAGVATVLLAYGNARAVRGNHRFLIAHLTGLGATFLLGRLGGTAAALAAVGVYALALLAIRDLVGFWLGVVVIPVLVTAAMLTQETRWLPAALLGLFGAVLLRPRPESRKAVGPLILPSLVFALLIALFHAGAGELPLLDSRHLSLALLLALVAPLLWTALGRAPIFVTIEVLLGLAVSGLGGSAVWVLLASLALLVGRDSRAVHGAAAGLLPLALLAMVQTASRVPLLVGLGLAAGLCLFGPIALPKKWPRWLGIPAVLAALATAAYYSSTGTAWLPGWLAAPLFAVGIAPFFLWAALRRGPDFVVVESVLAVALLVPTGIACALGFGHGVLAALVACAAALALLFPTRERGDSLSSPEQARALTDDASWLALPGFLAAMAALGSLVGPASSPANSATLAAASGLLPFFVWSLVRRRPEPIVIESVILTALLWVAGVGTALVDATSFPAALAAGVAGLALLLPMHDKLRQARTLALPFFLAAVAVLYLRCFADALPSELFPMVAAAALAPFLVVIILRGRPRLLINELLAATALLALVAVAAGLAAEWGSSQARVQGLVGLVALWMFLAAARTHEEKIARVAWIAVPLLSPIALLPLTSALMCWPAALAAVATVAILCIQSRRRHDSLMAAIGLTAGLLALAWAGAVTAKPFAHGGDPTRHLAKLAIVIAAYGMTMGSVGWRISAATARFLRRLETSTVLLAFATLLLGIGLRAEPGPGEAISVVLAFATLACAAMLLAFRSRAEPAGFAGSGASREGLGTLPGLPSRSNQGWPFYIAESALGLAYGFLRIRTGWLDEARDFDGLASCVFAFVNLGIGRTLRKWRAGFGAKESDLMGLLLPLVAPFFLQIQSPLRAVGTFGAAATYLWMARQRQRPLLGWVAGLLANIGLIPLWLHYDVHSPIAFALPVGTTLVILGHVYRNQMGKHGPLVRSLASLSMFGATSYQMFQFSSPWPALILALCAVVAIFLGILWRARAYLYIGFACLLLDILANLTRWGMADRLRASLLGLGAGMALLVLGILVARQKQRLLDRYRTLQSWGW